MGLTNSIELFKPRFGHTQPEAALCFGLPPSKC